MRKLSFEPEFDFPVEKIWDLFTDVSNYPAYIKYCYKAELIGSFAAGSSWYDWSTVVYFPMKVTHQIVKVEPKKEIVYKIALPTNGELWQKFTIEENEGKTKVKVEISVEFGNKLIDSLIGPLVHARNKTMIEATIDNMYKVLKSQ